jgi:hypothetical protein
MRARRVQLKLYARTGTLNDPERAAPVFHEWIRSAGADEILVDVARYAHVHEGPAVLLVGHETDYAIDLGEGRAGLVVTSKRARSAAPKPLSVLFARSFAAAHRIETTAALAGWRFRTDELLLVVPDRLEAPNDDVTFARLEDEIRETARAWLGEVGLSREGGEREPFSVRLWRTEDEPVAQLAPRAAAKSA